ncbi:Permease of the drug/metabolite transporter (DMT) superfamily [plant metagenome]|uniref:Permease of the drug/metabolite transporter (DMT) superfamily n=1 Tax=plant metagenome TaxID=1297885 RepID=A0A484RP83_9ZZZZ
MGVACALLVVALFSGFTLVSRLGFTRSPLTLPDIAALRFGVAGLLMLPVLWHYGLRGLAPRRAVLLAFLGGLGFALFAYAGFLMAPASHGAALLHGTLPLTTFLAAMLLTGAKAGVAKRTGLALIGIGVAAMAWDSLLGASSRQLLGDAALVCASLCWSFYAVTARRLGLAPAHAAAIVAMLSCLAYLPVYAVLPDKALWAAGWQDILIQAGFQGILLGVVSIFVYTQAVASLGAQETALFTAAVPCLTTMLAVALLGEMPTATAWAGVAVVTIGMAVALRGK